MHLSLALSLWPIRIIWTLHLVQISIQWINDTCVQSSQIGLRIFKIAWQNMWSNLASGMGNTMLIQTKSWFGTTAETPTWVSRRLCRTPSKWTKVQNNPPTGLQHGRSTSTHSVFVMNSIAQWKAARIPCVEANGSIVLMICFLHLYWSTRPMYGRLMILMHEGH